MPKPLRRAALLLVNLVLAAGLLLAGAMLSASKCSPHVECSAAYDENGKRVVT